MSILRRTVLGSTAAVAGAGIVLGLAFGVFLEPGAGPGSSCRTGLYPGTYADLLLPLHLLAFTVLVASLGLLSRRLGHWRPTAAALAAASAYVFACLAYPPLFGPYGVVTMYLSIPVTAALAIALIAQAAGARRQPSAEARWARFARFSWAWQWMALLVLLPGAYTYAWLNGAGVFCF